MRLTPQMRDIFPLELALKLAENLTYNPQVMAELLPSAAVGFTQALIQKQEQ